MTREPRERSFLRAVPGDGRGPARLRGRIAPSQRQSHADAKRAALGCRGPRCELTDPLLCGRGEAQGAGEGHGRWLGNRVLGHGSHNNNFHLSGDRVGPGALQRGPHDPRSTKKRGVREVARLPYGLTRILLSSATPTPLSRVPGSSPPPGLPSIHWGPGALCGRGSHGGSSGGDHAGSCVWRRKIPEAISVGSL